MAKEIWINASVRGCQFLSGKMSLDIVCGHHRSTGESVQSHAVSLEELKDALCFTKGMINSSQNALVSIEGGWAPIGRLNPKFELRHGVRVHKIFNDFSRDGDIECVESKDDAEKLCLLSQRFHRCGLSLLDIAKANGLDPQRVSTRVLRSLKNFIDGKVERSKISDEELMVDDNTKLLILAGR